MAQAYIFTGHHSLPHHCLSEPSWANERWRIQAGLRRHAAQSSNSSFFILATELFFFLASSAVVKYMILHLRTEGMIAFVLQLGCLCSTSRYRGLYHVPLSSLEQRSISDRLRTARRRMQVEYSTCREAYLPRTVLASMSKISCRSIYTTLRNVARCCLVGTLV